MFRSHYGRKNKPETQNKGPKRSKRTVVMKDNIHARKRVVVLELLSTEHHITLLALNISGICEGVFGRVMSHIL